MATDGGPGLLFDLIDLSMIAIFRIKEPFLLFNSIV